MGLLFKRNHYKSGLDGILLFLTILAACLGLVAVYSATKSYGGLSYILVQGGAFVIGAVCMMVISHLDYEKFGYLVIPAFVVSIGLLVLVLFVGTGANQVGAKSWIRFGPVGIQPAEIAKLGFILTFSFHLSKTERKIDKLATILFYLVHLGIFLALIMKQPDAGSAMVFGFITLVLLFSAGIPLKYILWFLGIGAASCPILYKFVLSDYQRHRIDVFLNPELDPLASGYNVIQSKISVGSGGLFGKGYLNGTQNQLGFLPAKHTDFIFSTIGEEWGFVGATVVAVLLIFIILRCFSAGTKCQSRFGRYICIGVGAMLLFHTFENIGMCIGLMPVTGIPLPFFSYGGTSMLTNLLAIGMVLSVSRRNRGRVYL